MKEIAELNFPDSLRYSRDHEWARPEGELFRIGISDFAQDQLGDIVFVDLPSAGDRFAAGSEFGAVESVKTASDLIMPVSGEVVEVNAALDEAPDRVNGSPYDEGWMILVRPDDPSSLDALLSSEGYVDFLKSRE